VVWADPVTGSSSTPVAGKKQRETKSQFCPSAETIKPRAESCFNFSKSIFKLATSSSLSLIQ